ncbi:arylesterase [Phenylobacterium sp.]|jgi:acyl-CoA thioesterase-1|uniref:arylesterase n=1 Tax=Phenylobacterium sp. TaxID=1871053 RepID=UPI002E32C41B|nr:arylesterase [Phenylobacterium sp.]HEX4711234.1 arylesterase [Phenylobacterium sp.]
MAVTRPVSLSRRTLIAAGLGALPARALAARGQVVTVLGDSITAGLGLPAQAALPAQLHLALEKLGVHNVVRGAGVSGDTSGDGASRIDFSVQPDTAVVVVALGGNDLLQGVDPKTTRANLDRILNRLKQRRMGVVLAGLRAPPELGRGYARDFDAVFASLAKTHRVTLYPDLLAGVGRIPALNQSDAIHPNAQGVQVIAARLAPVVARELAKRT